jgi:hypothetical protein
MFGAVLHEANPNTPAIKKPNVRVPVLVMAVFVIAPWHRLTSHGAEGALVFQRI